jgi:hypothetical protein
MKSKITVTGYLTSEEKQSIEAEAEKLGYIHGRKGSIFRLLQAIARGDVILVRTEKTTQCKPL